MTFEELLKACSKGKMPMVLDPVKNRIGYVTTIKDNGKHKGCAVAFHTHYDEWFWDSTENDKRRQYLRNLELKS